MSGKRISQADRRMISSQRRYVKRIRESMLTQTPAFVAASDKALREFERIGK